MTAAHTFVMKKLLLLFVCCCVLAPAAYSRTNWRFYVGGMYAKAYGWGAYTNSGRDTYTKSSYNIWAGMDVQFIIKEKFHIETGINYRRAPYALRNSSYLDYTDLGTAHWIAIPLRFAYRLPLNEQNSFEFGFGPYVAMSPDFTDYDPMSVGISPVVTYKHRALSLSFRYENPIFYDGAKNTLKNQFAFTIGVNFNGRKPNWDNIAKGLEVTGSVLNAANAAIGAYNGNQSPSTDGSYEDNTSSQSSKSSSGTSSGNRFSISEQTSYNQDKSTYEKYDSQLASHFAGNQTMSPDGVRHAQKAMKKLRQKWEKRGKSFPHSSNESR